MNELTPLGLDKVQRYGWTMQDKQGEQCQINKNLLLVNDDYQRTASSSKILEIASEWSWIGCGVIIVAKRDGSYWVIDGQHRVLAAKRRSDIKEMPCIVFDVENICDEASGFLATNTNRKPVTSHGKHKALVVSGDEIAIFVEKTFNNLGVGIRPTAHRAGETKSIGWAMRRAADDKEKFIKVVSICFDICIRDNMPIPERLLEGIWILNSKCGNGLNDKRLEDRIRGKGGRALLDAANKACAYYAAGGGAIWAKGILSELNKGLINKFTMNGEDA